MESRFRPLMNENKEVGCAMFRENMDLVKQFDPEVGQAIEQEYNRQIAQYIQRGRETSFDQELMEETSDRFSLMIQLTEYEN